MRMTRSNTVSVITAHTVLVSLAAVLFLLGVELGAQTVTSTLRGTAFDVTGAVVPDAGVTVVNQGTGLRREVATNANGDYEVIDLTRGTYRLTAELAGFKTFVADNIILESSQVRRIDITLEVGAVEAEVTVTADAAVIQTETAKIQTGFQNEKYDNFPLVSQYFDPNGMLATLPNVQSPQGGYGVRFAGQPPSQIQEGMDGATNDGIVNQINNLEDMQELQAVMVNAPAEYSRPGNFNMVTKSGTNLFHGRAEYYQENSALNARDFFEDQKTKTLLHTVGASLSGPIRKDKTFFYTSIIGFRVPSKSFRLRTVPTLKMRDGDFSQVGPVTDPLSGDPFVNDVIPASRMSPTSQTVQDRYMPPPNRGGPDDLSSNYGFVFPYPGDLFRADYITNRVDHQISENNTIFGRYVTNWFFYVLPGSYPGLEWTRERHNHHVVFSDTHVFSPNLVNTATFGLYQVGIGDGTTVDGFTPVLADQVVSEIGLQGVNTGGHSTMGFPRMDITGYSSITVRHPAIRTDNTWTFKDAVSWTAGNHVWKFGAEYRRFTNFNGDVPTGTYGRFGFNGSHAGHPYADFLLGAPFSSQRLDPLTNRDKAASEFGIYVQDTFKVSSRLSLDYGVRWDLFSPPTFGDGLQFNWDPASGNVIVPSGKLGSISPLYPIDTINVVEGQVVPGSDKGNFAPRFGFAYRIRPETVLRGGYGIYNESLGRYSRGQGTGPFQLSETFFNSVDNGQFLFAFPNPFPAGAGQIASQSVSGYPLDTKHGYIQQFNLTLEQQIKDIGFRLSYIGSRSRNLNYNLSTNKPMPGTLPFSQDRRPFPQFVNTSFSQSNGSENYDAMSFEVNRKVASDITFQGHWTWAHKMSDFLNRENPYNPLHWNRDRYTPRHRASINAIWNLPFGRGKRFGADAPAALNHVIGGWTLFYLAYFQTGSFFTPRYSGSDPSGTNTFSGLPDRISDGNLSPSQRRADHWFDTAAFTAPPPGRFGNSGYNILEGPGLHVHNTSFSKKVNLTERVGLQLMLVVSNIFHLTNFNFPSTNISVPGGAGVISCTWACDPLFNLEKAGPRRMEMRARIEF